MSLTSAGSPHMCTPYIDTPLKTIKINHIFKARNDAVREGGQQFRSLRQCHLGDCGKPPMLMSSVSLPATQGEDAPVRVFMRTEWKDTRGTWRQHLSGKPYPDARGFDEELRQGLKRREEGGARSYLVMEGAVLEEVWGGEGGLSAGRGAQRDRGWDV